MNNIPSYWLTYLENKIPSIKEKIDKSIYSFIFITDIHINTNRLKSGLLLKYLKENLNINEILFGGDIVTDYNLKIKAIKEINTYNELYGDLNMLVTYGNHDANSKTYIKEEEYLRINEFKELVCKNSKVKYIDNKMCGTYDDNINKIRYIILDSGCINISYLDEIQLDFLESKLLELDSTWKVIISIHRVFVGTELNLKNPKIELHDDGITLKNKLDSIKDKIKCKVIGIFSGHNHIDCDLVDNFNYVATTCDAALRNSLYDANYPIREEGTTDEQAFDIVIVYDNYFETIRIGAGDNKQNRRFNY